MSDTTVRHALSGAAAALTRGSEDVTDAPATLVADCAAGLRVAAVAVMTCHGDGALVAARDDLHRATRSPVPVRRPSSAGPR